MMDVVKTILRKLGINLEDVTIQIGTDLVIPDNDWYMAFDYKDFMIVIELNKAGSRESWISLIKYFNNDYVDSHRIEVINTSPQELYEIIKEFINKEEN